MIVSIAIGSRHFHYGHGDNPHCLFMEMNKWHSCMWHVVDLSESNYVVETVGGHSTRSKVLNNSIMDITCKCLEIEYSLSICFVILFFT